MNTQLSQKHSKLASYATILVGAFILMIFALYDNYPVVTSDSGTYISSGFDLIPPMDRPIFYGLFIRFTSLGASLWLTVFFQSLLLSYLLIRFIRNRLPAISNAHVVAFLFFLSVCTIGGWFAGQIMPDIFVSIDEPGMRV